MSAHEIGLGFAWLYSVLSADTTLQGYAPGGVWRALAPPSIATPYVILIYQAGSDTTNFGAVRGYSSMLYQAKAVGPASSSANIVNAAGRIDALITTAAQITVTGGIVKACYREQPLQIDELVTGELWSNWGGLYRLMITAT